jgi:hypothetical protein
LSVETTFGNAPDAFAQRSPDSRDPAESNEETDLITVERADADSRERWNGPRALDHLPAGDYGRRGDVDSDRG